MRLRLFVRASTLAALSSVLLSIQPAVPQPAAALAGRVTSTATP